MRIDIPDDRKLTYEMVIPVRWGDMDAMGHVNNTIYFRYFETLRIEWMRSIGFVADPRGTGFVIANAFCNFIRQIEYPGDLLARHYAANPGRTSFDTYFTLERGDAPGVICANGGATMVWVDFASQRPQPLPDPLRAHLLPKG